MIDDANQVILGLQIIHYNP